MSELGQLKIYFLFNALSFINLGLFFWFHNWEVNNISNRKGISEEHDKSIYSYTKASCGGHSLANGFNKFFIHWICFIVACYSFVILFFKKLSLEYRIIKFRISIAKFKT